MSSENAIRARLAGLMPTTSARDVQRLFEKAKNGVIASAVATTPQAEKILGVARRPCKLSMAQVITDTTAAGDATSYATFCVFKRTTTTPGTAVTLCTASTTTVGLGTITAWTAEDLSAGFSATPSVLELGEGDVLTWSILKAAGGVALGTGILDVDVEELSE
jgi:hypothetical protein